jgi:L-lysine exporter family protein LysE/ArgO
MLGEITAAFVPGLLLGLSLIVAIGAQNAFVLRQGLRREHVFVVCLICTVSDGLLIAAGVAGFGQIIARLPWLEPAMRYGGAAFLLFYAGRSWVSAWRGSGGLSPLDGPGAPLVKTALVAGALTWLNPHVYLDTVVLLGSISTQYDGHRVVFALGAMSGSLLFFFTLGYGARYLRPVFASAVSWRVLDGVIGGIMAVIAVGLVR